MISAVSTCKFRKLTRQQCHLKNEWKRTYDDFTNFHDILKYQTYCLMTWYDIRHKRESRVGLRRSNAFQICIQYVDHESRRQGISVLNEILFRELHEIRTHIVLFSTTSKTQLEQKRIENEENYTRRHRSCQDVTIFVSEQEDVAQVYPRQIFNCPDGRDCRILTLIKEIDCEQWLTYHTAVSGKT